MNLNFRAEFCLLLWSTLLVSGCRPALKPTDIPGKYEPDASTKQTLIKMGYATNRNPVLKFGADESLSMTNMPDVWLNINRDGEFERPIKNPGYNFGVGHWSLSPERDFTWHIDFDFEKFGCVANGTITNLARLVVGGVQFSNRKKPFQIRLVVGDPDSGDYLVFRKIEKN